MGTAALVACRNAVRGDRRCIPDAEHVMDERRACPGKPPPRSSLDRGWNQKTEAGAPGTADSVFRIFPSKGQAVENICRVSRSPIWRIVGSDVRPADGKTAWRTPGTQRRWSGNR